MKTSIDHLPLKAQRELAAIVERIKEIEEPEKIILFGSHASGQAVNDAYYKDGVKYEYISDYDILILYDKSRLKLYEIEDKIQQTYSYDAPLNTLIMYMEVINEQLQHRDYFYTEIIQKGILLHDKGNCSFATPKILSKKEKIALVEEDFKRYSHNAVSFLKLADLQIEMDRRSSDTANLTTHLLFQAAELFYTTVLMVYIGYKPKTHNLNKYRKLVKQLAVEITEVFPIKGARKEERMLFDVLNKAYIGGKYKTKFAASFDDAKKIIDKITILKDVALELCRKKIEELKR